MAGYQKSQCLSCWPPIITFIISIVVTQTHIHTHAQQENETEEEEKKKEKKPNGDVSFQCAKDCNRDLFCSRLSNVQNRYNGIHLKILTVLMQK